MPDFSLFYSIVPVEKSGSCFFAADLPKTVSPKNGIALFSLLIYIV